MPKGFKIKSINQVMINRKLLQNGYSDIVNKESIIWQMCYEPKDGVCP